MVRRLGWAEEQRELDAETRRASDGSFVRLREGYTHFEAAGAGINRAVVLVHGFSVPLFIWDPTFNALTAAGRHTIRYDLFGRGMSDRPLVAYNLGLFVDQLLDLLDALEQRQVDLVGLSMGGPIVAAFAGSFPARVRRIVLIDPVGAQPLTLGLMYRLASLPVVSDLVFDLFGTRYMLDKIASDFFDAALVNEFRLRYQVQMQYRGFKRAILSSVRHKMLGDFSAVYSELGRLRKPILLIWGKEDRTVPFEQSAVLRELLPGARFVAVPECGHVPHLERPGLVHREILDFLN